MDTNINFPNLGIFVSNVGRFININGFQIAYYGICISLGMLFGFGLALHEAKISGQNQDDYYNMGIVGIIASLIGARLYYVIFSWDEYKNNLSQIFNFRAGGLAIYGGIITAIIVMIVYSKVKKLNVWQVFDTVSLAILIGQVIGRWGNFFNREVFGGYTKSLLAMEIPVNAVNDYTDITSKMIDNLVIRNGIKYISVHPTFLYESLWNLMILVILLIYKKHKKFQGEVFWLYLIGYGIGRFWIEAIRTDQLMISGTSIPVSQAIAAGCVVIGLIAIFYKRIKQKKDSTI